jgi:hypothetical protein
MTATTTPIEPAVIDFQGLRSGEATADPRLDRVRHVDLRSLDYPVAETLAAEGVVTPRSYTWKLAVQLDQGREGACVGFGWAHELAARPAEVEQITNAFAREHIYWEAQKIDQFPGGAYPGAVPFGEGTSVLAGARVVAHLGYIDEYRWALAPVELVLAVGYKGPAVIGVDWYEGMMRTDADGFIRPTGRVVGGHCVVVHGVKVVHDGDGRVDPTRSYVRIQNSWGPDWGLNGRCRLSFIDLAVLWPAGDFCIPLGRTVTPTPDETAGDG